MLAYLATKKQFLIDAPIIEDVVRDAVKAQLNLTVKENEYLSWRNSLGNAMANVLHSPDIPEEAGIAIEYRLNGRGFRLDFVISGNDASERENLVIVELKQWTEMQFSLLEDHVKTILGGAWQEPRHPSYQAWSYKTQLDQFNEYVYGNSVDVTACAYLHNCKSLEVIADTKYDKLLSLAPVFIHGQSRDLVNLISSKISVGTGTSLLKRVDDSRIRPSTQLAEAVGKMLNGKDEFVLIDEQKTVLEKILLAARSDSGTKSVLIIKGGPGTGKSVIAINALAKLTSERLNIKYVTANAAPRTVFETKLKDSVKGDVVKHLFGGTGSYTESEKDSMDVLIVDEAHRLRLKSGMFKNMGEDQAKEIIQTARTSVFFIDEAQKVTWSDVGEVSRIKGLAAKAGADVEILELVSQFRCGGSDDYLAWLDHILGVQDNPNNYFTKEGFDFQVMNSPEELHSLITQKNEINNKSRVVAGYCWNWLGKKDPRIFDIHIGDYQARWNLVSYGNDWIIDPNSVSEVGCIHTCQGLEVDYIGVIVGDDLKFENGQLMTNPAARAKTDASLNGYKKELKENPIEARIKADELIRNTYRTLMSRGMKGCYVYFTDKATSDYFKGLLPS